MNNSAPPLALTTEDVAFVNDLAKRAGRMAFDMRSAVTVSEKSGPRDFVTSADVACSRLIVDGLRMRFPEDVLISEEEVPTDRAGSGKRCWMIDPIDGTENYIANDGMYSVMIGLLIDNQPAYGWVYAPSSDSLYVAVPGQAVVKIVGGESVELPRMKKTVDAGAVRLMMGNRDREQHPWVESMPGVEIIRSGSVGLRVAMIIEGRADVYLHLAGKLKVWDTAAPAAMALSGGLEIGSFEFDGLPYDSVRKQMHEFPIAIGTSGVLAWMRASLSPPPSVPLLK